MLHYTNYLRDWTGVLGVAGYVSVKREPGRKSELELKGSNG